MAKNPEPVDTSVEPGEQVYDEDGHLLGVVSGITDDGFEAEALDDGTGSSEEIPGQEFGEGYLMWRCTECGEMDEIEDGLPGSCPSCGAEKEAITEVRED
jgi:rubredoxin